MHQRKTNLLLKITAVLAIVAMLFGIEGGLVGSIKNYLNPKEANASEQQLNIWWPKEDSHLAGLQPFKAMFENRSVNDYQMYWQVDGDRLNPMDNNYQDHPHKEAPVDLTDWKWNSDGKYLVNFVAVDQQGNRIAERAVTIYANEPNAQVSSSVQSNGSKVAIQFPTDNAKVTGSAAFKGTVDNMPLGNYKMYWQVDGDRLNPMDDSNDGYPHKEAMVGFSDWNWRGEGPYTLNFVATDLNEKNIGSQSIVIYVPKSSIDSTVLSANSNSASSPSVSPTPSLIPSPISTPTPSVSPAPTPVSPSFSSSSGNPFQGEKFYVNPNSDPKRHADAWRSSRPKDAALMDKIGNKPESTWIGDWNPNVSSDVKRFTDNITAQGAMPVFVAYDIPQRDCGGYSSGGAGSPDAYKAWIRGFADGIGNRKAAVILEPDAMANMDCLSSSDKETRIGLIKDAINVFNSKGNISVYMDASNPNWIEASEMARRLKQAGIDQAKGFALNVSNFISTADNIAYGSKISSETGGKHFVIDTSRNGLGPTSDFQWCNPPGRALGTPPTTNTGNSLVDAYLWVKGPGGSDGACNGAPAAGVFWPEYALGLAERASW